MKASGFYLPVHIVEYGTRERDQVTNSYYPVGLMLGDRLLSIGQSEANDRVVQQMAETQEGLTRMVEA